MNEKLAGRDARILLIDDHQIVRDGLRLLLRGQPGVVVVGDAFDSDAGWEAVKELKPDLVLLDVELPTAGGIALARRILAGFPDIKVVMLTAHADPKLVDEALRTGVHGYMLKLRAGTQLLAGLRAVLAGNIYLCPEVSTVVVQCYQRHLSTAGAPVLSEREREIVRQLADGHSTKEIAFALGVSPKTVETHRSNVMAKLGITSVAGLTKFALREGLTSL